MSTCPEEPQRDVWSVCELEVSLLKQLKVVVYPPFSALISLHRFWGQEYEETSSPTQTRTTFEAAHPWKLSLDLDQSGLTSELFCMLCRSGQLADRCDAGSECLMGPVSPLGPGGWHKLQKRATR